MRVENNPEWDKGHQKSKMNLDQTYGLVSEIGNLKQEYACRRRL